MFKQKSTVNVVAAIMLTLCAYGTASGQFFNGTNNTTSDIDRTGRVSIGSSTFPTGLQFLVTGGNIGQRQTTGVTFGGTSQGDLWTAIGGNPGVPNLPGLYGLKHQWGQYAINFQLQARSTTSPDTQIKDAVIAWNSSNGSGFGNGNLRIGNIDGSNNFLPRMTFLDNGNVGIGTIAPNEKFRVEGSTASLTSPLVSFNKTSTSTSPNLNYAVSVNDELYLGSQKREFLPRTALVSTTNGLGLTLGVATNASQPSLRSYIGISEYGMSLVSSGNNVTINAGSVTLPLIESSLIPLNLPTYYLGSSTNRWNTVYTINGVVQTSDRREKDNIKKLDYGLVHINKLTPVTYTWKERPEQGIVVGLIAQDLQKIIPEVVHDPATAIEKDAEGKTIKPDPNAPLGIRYSDLIPVLINAIKELNQIVEAQQETIAQIQSELGTSDALVNGSSLTPSRQLAVYQNIPNPSTQSTTINYYIPETVQSAKLIIFNLNGEQKVTRDLLSKGEGSVTLSRSDLNPGMYFYILIGDGQATKTMRMIISN